MKRRVWVALASAIVLVAAGGVVAVAWDDGPPAPSASSSAAPPPLPASMASVGDSITRAFNIDRTRTFQDTPAQSWATGTDAIVNSHYQRILAANAAIAGRVFNDARSGAQESALDQQMTKAASQQVGYVTVLMGANDVCTPSAATMTSTDAFQASFARALADFFAADPGAHVFVSSIPDLFQLWNGLHTNPVAQTIWTLAHICQSLLSLTATTADRDAVVARELADNSILQTVCARYPHCRFDGFATYRARFGPADVSTVDYFHPSVVGQQMLASVTWAASYWPNTP